MLVRNAANNSWDEVQSIGNYFINTISSAGSAGDTPPGGSATFNGTAQKFTLSNPGSVAEQHIVSINGVIQKPNAGTSTPSEGFSMNGAVITFSAAPPASAPFFIITIGAATNIGTPSDNTVDTDILQSGCVTNDKVSATAAIAGSKISPDFGSQNIVTTGSVGIGDATPLFPSGSGIEIFNSSNPRLKLSNTNTGTTATDGTQFYLAADGTTIIDNKDSQAITFHCNAAEKVRIDSAGKVGIGTTAPEEILHIKGPSETVDQRDGVFLQHSTASNAADNGLPLVWSGFISSSNQNYGLASICGRKENSTDNNASSYLQFATCNAAGSLGEKARIASDGNVGIGTASPSVESGWSRALHLNASSDGAHLRLTDSTSGSGTGDGSLIGHFQTNTFLINKESSGNIIFNTNSSERLRVDASGRVLIGATSSTSTSKLAVNGSTSGTEAFFELNRTDDPSDGQNIGIIEFSQGDAASRLAARLITRRDGGVWGAASLPTRFEFHTCANGSNSAAERMRITSDGKIGIGTTDPQVTGIHINGTNSRLQLTDSTTGTASGDGVIFGLNGDQNFFINNRESSKHLLFFTENTERMRLLNGGNLVINSTGIPVVGTEKLGVDGGSSNTSVGIAAACSNHDGIPFFASNSSNTTDNRLMRFAAGAGGDTRGTIIYNGSAMVYGGTSDYRLKENITAISNGITKLKNLNPVNFNWIKDTDDKNVMGFLAHEVQEVMPEVVTGTKDAVDSEGKPDYQEMDYGRMSPLIVAALKEAVSKIETLETKVAALESA
jgi:hypothetical protein